MAHQADFLRRELPTGMPIGPDGDIDFFVLPSAGRASAPLLLGGTLAAPLSDDESASAAMQLIAGQALAERLNQTEGFLSPHLGVDRASVSDATTRRLLDLLATGTDVRFDGSDLMPPAVGIGTFWTGMRAFFAGEDVDTLVAEIQAGWPATEAE
jgi:alpha-glucoside transport system substrate-binding protein